MFYNNDDFRQDGYDDIDINITNQNYNTNTNANMNVNEMNMGGMAQTVSAPIVEQGRERVVYRNIYHEVPHVCPINTRIINNHIYRHTYQPRYTCFEENTCTNVQCGSCCQFK